MKRVQDLSRSEIRDLKTELESLLSSYDIDEIGNLIKTCGVTLANIDKDINIKLDNIIGKTFYYGDSDTDEYFIVKVKSIEEDVDWVEFGEDDEYINLCYEGVYFDGENLSRITDDSGNFSVYLHSNWTVEIEDYTMEEISESEYDYIVNCFNTVINMITKNTTDKGIKFVC